MGSRQGVVLITGRRLTNVGFLKCVQWTDAVEGRCDTRRVESKRNVPSPCVVESHQPTQRGFAPSGQLRHLKPMPRPRPRLRLRLRHSCVREGGGQQLSVAFMSETLGSIAGSPRHGLHTTRHLALANSTFPLTLPSPGAQS